MKNRLKTKQTSDPMTNMVIRRRGKGKIIKYTFDAKTVEKKVVTRSCNHYPGKIISKAVSYEKHYDKDVVAQNLEALKGQQQRIIQQKRKLI